MVLCGGKLIGIVNGKYATKEQIGLMMAGHIEEIASDFSEEKENVKGGDLHA